jgi:hypothetical protein
MPCTASVEINTLDSSTRAYAASAQRILISAATAARAR